jgi:hypothetical protein
MGLIELKIVIVKTVGIHGGILQKCGRVNP